MDAKYSVEASARDELDVDAVDCGDELRDRVPVCAVWRIDFLGGVGIAAEDQQAEATRKPCHMGRKRASPAQ